MLNSLTSELERRLKGAIREVPDFPKPGINFYDITTVLADGELFALVIDCFAERYSKATAETAVDAVVAIESRGFIFGAALAYRLGKAFVPIRKMGKLPAAVERAQYRLEYGSDAMEIHSDALKPGARAVLVDDVLATGGTASAASELITRLGAEIVECLFLIELSFLPGRSRLAPTPLFSLVSYEE